MVDEETEEEMKRWKRFEINRLGKKDKRQFKCERIPVNVQEQILASLETASTVDDIEDAFNSLGATVADQTSTKQLLQGLHDAVVMFKDSPQEVEEENTYHQINISLHERDIKIDVPPQRAPEVFVNVPSPPETPAPVVNVQNDIHVPEQPGPDVIVNIPEPKPRKTTVERDRRGDITELKTE